MSARVVVVGGGPQGLTVARTLLEDGFDVTLLCADGDIGGVWSADRISPGLASQSPAITMELAGLSFADVQLDEHSFPEGYRDGQIYANVYNKYLRLYADRYLKNIIQTNSRVNHIERNGATGWKLDITKGGESYIDNFDKVVLATGLDFLPRIPPVFRDLESDAPALIHSGAGVSAYEKFAARVKDEGKPVLVVGYGKSAIDATTWLHKEGFQVTVAYRDPKFYMSAPKRPPENMLLSRLLTYLWPARTMTTRWEWFLHDTRLGVWLVQKVFDLMHSSSVKLQKLGKDSTLTVQPADIFWKLQMGGAILHRPGTFFELVEQQLIKTIGPTTVTSIKGKIVTFANGESLEVGGILLATGWDDSMKPLFTAQDYKDLGISPQPATEHIEPQKDRYLQNAPLPPNDFAAPRLYKGIVPIGAYLQRDLVVANTIWPSSGSSVWEAHAHFVSSIFLNDPFMKIPKTVAEASHEIELDNAFARQRFPGRNLSADGHPITYVIFFAFARHVDEMIGLLSLEIFRGCKGFFWPLGPLKIQQLENLHEERAALRKQYAGQ